MAEALLDLTGAPTEVFDFSEGGFDPEDMWARLCAYKALGLPMGCGTNSAVGREELKQVGLVGGHAYSLLDVREARARSGESVRLVRIRNPHGVGEWNGEWSDASEQWKCASPHRPQPRATARNHPQPRATARNHPQPPATACNRVQPRATARNHAQPRAAACSGL